MRVDFVPPLFQVRPARPSAAWACVSLVALGLLAWPSTSSAAATSPDSAGLVGSSPERPTLPFKLWARSPKSPLKPRRRDLREPELRLKMGDDFDPRWMRTHAYHGPDPPEGPRQSVQKLVALAAREALPEDLNPAARETVRAWLVRRATCPVRYQWGDLGPYFWPRWVRRGQCASDGDGQTTTTPATAPLPLSDTPFPKSLGNVGVEQRTETPDKEDDWDDDSEWESCETGKKQSNATFPRRARFLRSLPALEDNSTLLDEDIQSCISSWMAGLEKGNFSSLDVERNSSSGMEDHNSTLVDEDLLSCVVSTWISGMAQRNLSSLDEGRNSTSGLFLRNSTVLYEDLQTCISSCIPGVKQRNSSSLGKERNSTSGLKQRNSTSLDGDLLSCISTCISGVELRNFSSLDVERNLSSAARNVSRGEGNGASGHMGETTGHRPCSWPPGMRCVPSAAKVLQLLRWHCRLRKSALSNSVWVQAADRKKRRRHRFRCQWLKVPYPVAEDCTCA